MIVVLAAVLLFVAFNLGVLVFFVALSKEPKQADEKPLGHTRIGIDGR
jgi:hypothetical protein